MQKDPADYESDDDATDYDPTPPARQNLSRRGYESDDTAPPETTSPAQTASTTKPAPPAQLVTRGKAYERDPATGIHWPSVQLPTPAETAVMKSPTDVQPPIQNAALVTPVKKPRKKYIAVFRLMSGHVAVRKTKKSADNYETGVLGNIKHKEIFSSEEEFQSYMANNSAPTAPGVAALPGSTSAVVPNCGAIEQQPPVELVRQAHAIVVRAENLAPMPRLATFYYTYNSTIIVVFVMAILNANGTNFWLFKSNDFLFLLKGYITAQPPKDPEVLTILNTLTKAKQRDVSKGPDKQKFDRNFGLFLMSGHFKLDLTKITSLEQEQTYIKTTLTNVSEAVRGILRSDLYLQCLRDHYKANENKMLESLTTPKHGPGFKKFMEQARIVVEPMTDMTHYITTDEADHLHYLMDCHQLLDKNKYEPDDLDESEGSDGEVGDHATGRPDSASNSTDSAYERYDIRHTGTVSTSTHHFKLTPPSAFFNFLFQVRS